MPSLSSCHHVRQCGWGGAKLAILASPLVIWWSPRRTCLWRLGTPTVSRPTKNRVQSLDFGSSVRSVGNGTSSQSGQIRFGLCHLLFTLTLLLDRRPQLCICGNQLFFARSRNFVVWAICLSDGGTVACNKAFFNAASKTFFSLTSSGPKIAMAACDLATRVDTAPRTSFGFPGRSGVDACTLGRG